jgi:hypothetical protein
MITPVTLNSASVVAIAEHSTQNPGSFFVLIDTGLVWKGFTTALMTRAPLYSFQVDASGAESLCASANNSRNSPYLAFHGRCIRICLLMTVFC